MANFLDLPYELREEIYIHLLTYPPEEVHRNTHQSPASPGSTTPEANRPDTSILYVSRKIHGEAAPILYTHNTFRCHSSLLTAFPRLQAPDGAGAQHPKISESTCPSVRLIRRWYLHARLDCGPFWDAETVTNAFTRAEELTIEVRQSMFRESGNDVLRMFEGVRGIKRVSIWGSTTGLESYVRWLEAVMTCPVGIEIAPFADEDSVKGTRHVRT